MYFWEQSGQKVNFIIKHQIYFFGGSIYTIESEKSSHYGVNSQIMNKSVTRDEMISRIIVGRIASEHISGELQVSFFSK